MFKKDIKTGILGVAILVLGVIVGLILINQTQEFRNAAKENVDKKYIICHKETVNSEESWSEISVSQEELSEYLNTGDIFGNCPESGSN